MKRLPPYPCLLWSLVFLGSFLFFELNYRYWYRFMEQYSLFLYRWDYFADLCVQVGGFNAWVTAWVTQFFQLPCFAPLCLAGLLTLPGVLFSLLLKRSFNESSLRAPLLSLCPWFLFWLYPVESIAFLLALTAGLGSACLYTRVRKAPLRYLAGFALITLLYPLAAPAHLAAAAGILLYECIRAARGGGDKAGLWGLGLCLWALVLPLAAMRTVYVVPLREAFLSKHLFHPEYPLPASLWYVATSFLAVAGLAYVFRRRQARPREKPACISLLVAGMILGVVFGRHPLEQAYRYDWLARQGAWERIARDALEHPVKDKDALVYANLAHAYCRSYNEALLQLPQIGEEGFIPRDPKTRLGLIQAAEVSWLLNHTNSAQRFAFVGVLSSERNVQPRLMRRLIETYLVNEEYKAAEKYIRILEKSALYRREMQKLRPLLDPETASQTEWITQRRRLNPTTDNPYDPTKSFPSALAFLLDDHPDNPAAFAYGMGYLLLYKELHAFMHYMEERKGTDEKLPTLYQEAICIYYTAVENNPEAFRSYAVDPDVYQRYREYLQQSGSLSPTLLRRRYGDAYYYYAQFVPTPEKPAS
ncbi:MAG: DUF6057 family protein [Tannerellaceae bacterium]|jgi:hypothetical protein|nr:DUF6057 family protein [Tannerellaceae bacterium]